MARNLPLGRQRIPGSAQADRRHDERCRRHEIPDPVWAALAIRAFTLVHNDLDPAAAAGTVYVDHDGHIELTFTAGWRSSLVPTDPMNMTLTRFVVALLCLSGARVWAQDGDFHVFLCFGQSNMEGFPGIPAEDRMFADPRFLVLAAVDFPSLQREQGKWYTAVPPLCRPNCGLGPADYFGRTMVAHLPAHFKVGVVNVSVAGARIEVFDPERCEGYAATAPGWMQRIIASYGGNPYAHLVAMGRRAQQDGVIKGILLHQGEANTNDPDWPVQVKAIYERLLKDLNLVARDVPLLAGEVVGADQDGKCARMNAVIATLPEIIPTAHVVSSAGCASRSDQLHFAPEGYRELGRRFAETMLRLRGVPPKGEPAGEPAR